MGATIQHRCRWMSSCTMAGFCPDTGFYSRPDVHGQRRRPLPVNQDLMGVEARCPHEAKAATGGIVRNILCFLMLMVLLISSGEAHAVGRIDPDAPAAVVDGVTVTVAEFQLELDRVQRRHGTRAKLAGESTLAELKREALENLIVRELLFQESIRRKIAIDPELAERQLKELRGEFADEGQYTAALAKLKMNEETVKGQISRGLAIQRLIDELIGSRLTVTDGELTAYYDGHRETFTEPPQTRLSHILLAVDQGATEVQKQEARRKLAEIRARLLQGDDFAQLAQEFSDCLSKEKGGDIGWFAAGQITPAIEKAVAPLKINELSDIVEDRFGLHLIRVTERKAAFTPAFADLKEKIRGLVKQEKGQKELRPLVKKLRDGAKVEIVLQED